MCMSSFLYPFPFCHPMSVVTCSPWLDPAEWLRASHGKKIYPSIHPSILAHLSYIHLFVYLWLMASMHPSIHLSIYPSINPSIHLLIHPIIRLSIYLSIRHLSLQPSLHIYIYIYISFYFYVYVSLRCECTISLSRDISWVWAVLCMFFAIIQSSFIYLVLK